MLINFWPYLLSLALGYKDHLLKVKVIPDGLPAEKKQEIMKEILFKLDEYARNKELSHNLFSYLEDCYNVLVETYTIGCVEITVQCPTLYSLQRLWIDTLSSNLDKVVEKYLVTNTIKTKLGVDTVKFKVTIKEEDYLACKMSLLQHSGKFFHIFVLALYHLWTFERITPNGCISFDNVTLKCILEKRYLKSQSIYCQVKEATLM